MKTILHFLLNVVLITPCFSQTLEKSETVKLDGIDTYYEVYGDGEPLFLLHGWSQSTTSWSEYVSAFSDHFKVYLVDLKGHGKSSPLQGEFHMQSAADNFLALLDYLQLKEIKAIGLSYGGELLLQFSSVYSDRINSMIIIGASYNFPKQDWGWKYENQSPEQLERFRKSHIHGEDQIRAFFEQALNYEILLSKEDLEKISTSTLIVVGEKDHFVDLDTALNLHRFLPNSHLWIVPDTGHVAHVDSNKPEFIRIANKFLRDERK